MEVMVYLSLLAVIFGFAYGAYWRCLDNSKRLQQDSDEILQALDAGDLWRGDVRLAQSETVRSNSMTLAQAGDTVEYRFDKQCIWRHSSRSNRSVLLLRNVLFSGITPDPRQQVRAWKWELEMQHAKKPPYLRPLFTFEAVPAK
jgi:hypothetical protein